LANVTVRCANDLDPNRTIIRRGIRTTDPLRTLVDLSGSVSVRALTDAVDRGLATGLVTISGIVAEVNRLAKRGRRGIRPMRQLLVKRGFVGAPDPSVLESKTMRLLTRHKLPIPHCELKAGPDGEYRLDFAYTDLALMVEVDGYAWHFSPEHLRRDHARRNRLQSDGWRRVLVYTWIDITRHGATVAAEIRDSIRELSATSGPRGAAS